MEYRQTGLRKKEGGRVSGEINMVSRHFNVREVKARRTKSCPECGNMHKFRYAFEKVSQEEYLAWVSCDECGYSPTETESNMLCEPYVDTSDDYVLAALELWNISVID
jgi:transcription elongation factor Elf1